MVRNDIVGFSFWVMMTELQAPVHSARPHSKGLPRKILPRRALQSYA